MTLPNGKTIPNAALLLGNGINRYGSPDGGNSWTDLLADTADEVAGLPHIETDRILAENTISYPEFYDTVQMRAFQRDNEFDYRTLKPHISARIGQWESQNHQQRVVDHCIENRIPILTTNFDTVLSRSSTAVQQYLAVANKKRKKSKRQFPIIPQGIPFTDHYPWYSHYSAEKVQDALQDFAIWHIHGIHHYPRSLRLGLTDYIAMTDRAREWLHRSTGNPFNQYDQYHKWRGRGSWLEVFLMKPLIIVGLALESSEVGLRWLLIEREKLHRRRPSLAQPFYFCTVRSLDTVGAGKQALIESLGGSFFKYSSLTALYEDAFA